VSGHQIVNEASGDDEAAKTVTATCPGDKVVIGGGAVLEDVSDTDARIYSSYPHGDNAWRATGNDTTGSQQNDSYRLRVYAICADA